MRPKDKKNMEEIKERLVKLKKQCGKIYLCPNCFNIFTFDGWIFGEEGMGNNYNYIKIRDELYHYTTCSCKTKVLLGYLGKTK